MSEKKKELEQAITDLLDKAGYRLAIVAVSKSGAHLPINDVMIEGFGVAVILTKVPVNDANA